MPDPLGTFHQVVTDNSSRRTYVVFSSVNIEPGKFMFWNVMIGLPGTKIFVNDEQNGWYVHGIPGLGDSVIAAVHALAKLVRAMDPEEVVTIGPSMGGYGAMLYGALLKAELSTIPVRCLSFGGEFILYGRGTMSRLMSKKEKKADFADIRPILEAAALPVTNIYGDADVVDNAQADGARSVPSVRSIPVRNSPHPVSAYLGSRGLLSRAISAFVEGSEYPFLTTNTSSTPGFGALLQKGCFALEDRNLHSSLKMLGKAVDLCPENAIARHQLGNALAASSDIERALHQQERAVEIDPLLGPAYFARGALLRKLARNKESRECHVKAAQLMPDNIEANMRAAYNARNYEEWRAAEEFLRAVLKLEPAHHEAKQMLEGVLQKTLRDGLALLKELRPDPNEKAPERT